jgi:hypothetical protein
MFEVDLVEVWDVYQSALNTLKVDEQLDLCEAKLEESMGVLKCKYNILYSFLAEQRQVESLLIVLLCCLKL